MQRSPITRRSALKGLFASAGTLGASSSLAATLPANITGPMARPMDLKTAKSGRVVVVGAGWSGLSIAAELNKVAPQLDVVVLDKRSFFMSAPMGNLWLTGLLPLSFLTYSFDISAKIHGFTFVQAEAVALEQENRKVYTSKGYINYDFLVIAPGVSYDYGSLGFDDPEQAERARRIYPAGFIPGDEFISLKKKVDAFKGGTFLLTMPQGNNRCTPTIYERACLLAANFKRRRLNAKILLLDANPEIASQPVGFQKAFDELYADQIEYVSSTAIESVDLDKKVVATDFDEYQFNDAALYPRMQVSNLIERFGLADMDHPQHAPACDPLYYNVKSDERIYITGDSRSQPLSKSAGTAITEAPHIAKTIAARANGKALPQWVSPRTFCYSMVSDNPLSAIGLDGGYAYMDGNFTHADVNLVSERSPQKADELFAWSGAEFQRLFG